MTTTLVLDIKELYKVIPEAQNLEGKNFSNIKDLLVNLIEKIEMSGEWEFIQYVNNKPSLFVVRPKSNPKTSGLDSKQFQEAQNILKEFKKLHQKVLNEVQGTYKEAPATDSEDLDLYERYSNVEPSGATLVFKTEEMEKVEKDVENLGTVVPVVKLPWEK